MRAFLITVSLVALSLAAPVHAGILVGAPPDPETGNCIPFGCTLSAIYQQVYNSNAFPGAITITGLTFFHTQYAPGGDLNTGTYTVSLSTTSKAVDGLNTVNFDENLGADNALFFSGTLPASVPFGESFTLSGGPFAYDPALGNLLVDIRIADIGNTGPGTYLDYRHEPGTLFSRAGSFGGNSSGLVTQFETEAAAIPEPGTLSLLAAGLLALPLLRRRSG